MNWKITLISLVLIASLCITPVLAADFGPEEKGVKDKDKDKDDKKVKEIGKLKKIQVHADTPIKDAAEEVAKLKADKTKTSQQRLEEYPALFGYDDRLDYYLYEQSISAEITHEDENPVAAFFGGIVNTVSDFFSGNQKKKPETPYTQEEGEAAWSAYMASFIAGYEPTGEFGGPIR